MAKLKHKIKIVHRNESTLLKLSSRCRQWYFAPHKDVSIAPSATYSLLPYIHSFNLSDENYMHAK